ncbi:MAG: UbiA family prenyltransferase [Candidatus Riflebacteria bacterium]|nr:UbiA family prenyltransferase [Candidatus Riflebacteria bacterium]
MSQISKKVLDYSKLIKIEHTLFSLPMLFSGAILGAHSWPSSRVLALIVLVGFAARAFAMIMNRLIDRNIDARNPRTASREIPASKVSVVEALLLALVSLLCYLLLAWQLGPICLLLSPIPLVLFIGYPYLKRYTCTAHFGVGAALAMAPLGGFIAASQRMPFSVDIIALGLFVFFWVSGFDIIYATLDEEFDKSQGLFSLPAVCGRTKALRISGVLHFLAFCGLSTVTFLGEHTPTSLVILALTGIFLFLEHRFSNNVDLAFFGGNVVVGFLVLLLVNSLAAHG